jgi:two-component sensor histidine kinase
MRDDASSRISSLEKRNRTLAAEKAEMKLIIETYSHFINLENLQEILDFILQLTLNLHGGNNVVIYYFSHTEWHYKDIYGKSGIMNLQEDDLVTQAVEQRTYISRINPESTVPPFRKGGRELPQELCTTVFPLIYKDTVIAVVKLVDRLIWNEDSNKELMTFFKYAATTLYLSIKNYEILEVTNHRLETLNGELQCKVEELNLKSAQLAESLEQKELLLAEIHHRVKNNLQIMTSLIALQARNIGDVQIRAHLRDIEGRIKTMGIIHEHLYGSKDFSSINLQSYAEALLEYLFSSHKMDSNLVKLEIDVAPIPIDLSASIPCGLIINEIVSNSFKYAFPDGRRGRISIEIHAENDRCRMRIGDDGVGIPDSINLSKGGKLGMQLIRNLARQINGEIELLPGDGTWYTLDFLLRTPA